MSKTSGEMLNDSCDRASTQTFMSYSYDKELYYVYNPDTDSEYIVTVSEDSVIDCTCPHRQYRLSKLDIPCKHMMYVAITEGLNY